MSNTIVLDGGLSDGGDEVDLDLVRKLVVNLVLVPDSMVGADTRKRYLTGVEVRRIEWWDKGKPIETVELAIYGKPREIIRRLVLYRRKNTPEAFWSEPDRRGIKITTIQEELLVQREQQHKSIGWFFGDYLPSIASTAAEAKNLAKAAKPTRHYIIETLIVAVVCTFIGLFIGEDPARIPVLLPVEIVAVLAIVRFYGKVEKWLLALFRGLARRKGEHAGRHE